MAPTHFHSGHRTINYGNLVISLSVVVASFPIFLYLLTPGGLRELAKDRGRSFDVTDGLHPFVVADGTERVAVPSAQVNTSVLVAGPLGSIDAARSMADFFGLRVALPSRTAADLSMSHVTVSDVYRRLALFKLRQLNQSVRAPKSMQRQGMLRSQSAHPTETLLIDHVCSAASCVGPRLTHALLGRARAAWGAAADAASPSPSLPLLLPARVRVHLVGEPAVACLVGMELAADDICVADLTAHCGRNASSGAPAVATVAALYGSSVMAEGDSLHALCSPVTLLCTYGTTQEVAAAATSGDKGIRESKKVVDGAPPSASQIVAKGHAVRYVPLHRRSFTGSAEPHSQQWGTNRIGGNDTSRDERSPTTVAAADLVFIDVDVADAVAMVAYLRGVLQTCSDRTVTGEPSNILLTARPSKWTELILSALENLQRTAGYTIILLACPTCPPWTAPGQAGGTDPRTHESLSQLRAAWRKESALLGAGTTAQPALDRARELSAPATVVLLTRDFFTSSALADALFPVGEVPMPAARVTSVTAGSLMPTTRLGRPTAGAIRTAADRFFDSFELTLVHTQRQALRRARLDVVSAIGKWLYRATTIVVKVLLYGLPVTICVFLLANLSKAWRRH